MYVKIVFLCKKILGLFRLLSSIQKRNCQTLQTNFQFIKKLKYVLKRRIDSLKLINY